MVNFINRLVGATLVIALIESGRSQGSPLRKKQYNYNLKVRTEGALIYKTKLMSLVTAKHSNLWFFSAILSIQSSTTLSISLSVLSWLM